MNRTLTAAALVVLLSPVALFAQVDSIPVAAPLSDQQFATLAMYQLPGSQFSAGWDSIKAVSISEDRLIRLFYRKVDGLLVGVLEDNFGTVFAQTQAWAIGVNLDAFDATLSTRANPNWETCVTVFGYNRATGVAVRRLVWWQVQGR